MNSTIHDLTQADAVHGRIADLHCQIALREARAEARIARIKADLEADIAPLQTQLQALTEDLSRFIRDTRDAFARPRKRRTPWGAYGFQRGRAKLDLDDTEALLTVLRELGYTDLIKVRETVDRPALQDYLRDGIDIPGARLIPPTDDPVIDVDKAIIAQRLQEVAA